MKNKIGIGIITCNREEYFKKCVQSIPSGDFVVVVNDGIPYNPDSYPSYVNIIVQHKKNKGVGKSKNEAIRIIMSNYCDHIFICEDDIVIKDKNVFGQYIKAKDITGIQHFNYGYHGPLNKDASGKAKPIKVIKYTNEIAISFNRNLVGAFTYYSKEIIEKVGLLDTFYYNAFEHVDHTYKIIEAGAHPPFGWFADIENSDKLIGDMDTNLENSIIRANGVIHRIRMKLFSIYFKIKNHHYPWELFDNDLTNLEKSLDDIKYRFQKVH